LLIFFKVLLILFQIFLIMPFSFL